MQVTIKDVQVEWVDQGRGKKYGKAQIQYDYRGEPRKQNIMSFSNPDVFKKVQEMTGQTVEVELTKNDKGYTEWKSILAAQTTTEARGAATSTTATVNRASGYETKEERAAREVRIVKQSSLKAAVETMTPGSKAALDANAVIELAQKYTDWVFDTSGDISEDTVFDMKEDVPF